MRKFMRVAAVATAGVAVLALAGCGSTGTAAESGGSSDGIPETVDAAGETLTVWIMQDDYSDATLEAIKAEFTERTGAEADVQIQQWDGISTKLATALGSSTPPDVVDIGNTQVAGYAANGALMDVTAYKDDLAQGNTWLSGLEDPATIDGSLYAIPGFAGNRAVIYNKTMWSEAGVTEAPTTWDELTAALDKVKAANTASDFSALYLPGKHFYVGLQFVWDHGGEIATQNDDGSWTSTASDNIEALGEWQKFQDTYSAASADTVFTDSPEQEQIFADGKAGAIIATNGAINTVLAANEALTEEDLGTFALPSQTGDGTQPVMLGGSDWGIAAKSSNQELALIWTQIAISDDIQQDYVFADQGLMPNSAEIGEAIQADVPELKTGFFNAALTSRATPASPGWTDVEGAGILKDMFSTIASGAATPEEAAATYDEKANAYLK